MAGGDQFVIGSLIAGGRLIAVFIVFLSVAFLSRCSPIITGISRRSNLLPILTQSHIVAGHLEPVMLVYGSRAGCSFFGLILAIYTQPYRKRLGNYRLRVLHPADCHPLPFIVGLCDLDDGTFRLCD